MNNLTNLKKVLVMVIAIAVICLSTSVFAANDFTSLSSSLNNNNGGNSSQAAPASETSGSNSASNNSGTNSNTSGTTNLSTTTNNNAATNNSNATSLNSSSYNNTNLPETGLQDSLPIAVLVVVLGISAVYAYKKIKDYQNL